MALNVGGLTKFTNEQMFDLVADLVAKGKTANICKTVPGIKYSSKLNQLTNTVALQAGGCGFNTSGSVALTQRAITVAPIKVNDTICAETLEQYWLEYKMGAGSATEVPFSNVVIQSYIDKIAEKNEYTIWTGNLSGSSYTMFDGLLHILSGETSRVSGATFTGTTTLAKVNLMIDALPEEIIDRTDLVLFVSHAQFRALATEITSTFGIYAQANTGVDSKNYELMIPGSNVKVVATLGLKGKTSKVLTYAENIIIGTDLANEYEKVDLFYSQDNDENRVIIHYKLGVQVAYPEFVVTDF